MKPHEKVNGSLILYYRKRLKRTQGWLAHKVGVSQNTIHRWESGAIPKRWKEYPAVCDALGVDGVDLLFSNEAALYEVLKVRYGEALLWGSVLDVARLSQQVLNWEKFFVTGHFRDDDFADEEIAESSAVEGEIAEMFRGKTAA